MGLFGDRCFNGGNYSFAVVTPFIQNEKADQFTCKRDIQLLSVRNGDKGKLEKHLNDLSSYLTRCVNLDTFIRINISITYNTNTHALEVVQPLYSHLSDFPFVQKRLFRKGIDL